ncbi:hypothetical protein NF865_04990 [Thermococcus aggregans]|uniref:Uncharacterized protein n=1 Tax=Thermococcus aggregans TaxID=110163 RepID=A0A9E7MZB6_THEAG|nr:hypothetical protein [Thermococcus aggregans]USS41522.1 hypothetical protein NF865_04990 [Thermococcus aggregans]
MATFALWWFKWSGSNYESRMMVGSREATVRDFKDRGFDYLTALDGEGRASNYRAYYFSTDLRVIDEMESYCQNNLGGAVCLSLSMFSLPF